MKWLNVAGLIFNLVGAGVIAAGVIAVPGGDRPGDAVSLQRSESSGTG